MGGGEEEGDYLRMEVEIQGEGIRGPYHLDEGAAGASRFVFTGTDTVWVDRVQKQPDRDYTLDPFRGELTFAEPIPDTSQIRVVFRAWPFRIQPVYRHREMAQVDTTNGAGPRPSVRQPFQNRKGTSTMSASNPDQEGFSQLNVGGSKTVAITVGSNRDLSLDQALRLDISGQIAGGVEVNALLSDQNLPIQPEGTTETLRELDKVLVQIKTDHWAATLGDYMLNVGGELARYQRRLEGALGEVRYPHATFWVAGAVSKGIFHTNQFNGIEGNQGPYQLRAKDGDTYIVVLAGTERVWVNGERMTRGEQNDYTIEYGNGQITFTERRLITGDSRIVVDFEYTNRQYARSIVGGEGRLSAWGDRLQVGVNVVRERDDREHPIDLVLGPDERSRLRQAGDDPTRAWTSGVDSVGVDSSGVNRGNYRAVYDSTGARIYEYAGVNGGPYRVAFSWVGEKQGTYRYVGGGIYRYVGEGQGEYVPRSFLPLPQQHQVVDIQVALSPLSFWNIKGEWALSDLDRNTFSTMDDGDNRGQAFRVETQYSPEQIRIGRWNIGALHFKGWHRFESVRFEPLGRIGAVEEARYWGLSTSDTGYEIPHPTSNVGTRTGEIALAYRPTERSEVEIGYGTTRRGEIRSTRREVGILLSESSVPDLRYRVEWIESEGGDGISEVGKKGSEIRTRTVRHRGLIETTRWGIRPSVRYDSEEILSRQDGAASKGARFRAYEAELSSSGSQKIVWSVGVGLRADDVWMVSRWVDQSTAWTPRVRLSVRELRSLSLSAEVTRRERRFDPAYVARMLTEKTTGNTEKRPKRVQGSRLKAQGFSLSILQGRGENPFGPWALSPQTIESSSANSAVFNGQMSPFKDTRSDLARVRADFTPWDGALSASLNYQIANTQVAEKKRNYVYVGKGKGYYIWEDRNGNGNPEEDEFIHDPDGEYVLYVERFGAFRPVTEVRARARLKIEPGKTFKRSNVPTFQHSPERKHKGIEDKVLRALSAETTIEVEGKGSRGDVRSLLWLDTDTTRVRARRMVQQDLYLFRWGRAFTMRLRYRQRDDRNREFTTGLQISREVERSLKVRGRLFRRLEMEGTYSRGERLLEGGQITDYWVRSQHLEGTLSYRPSGAVVGSCGIEVGQDREQKQNLTATYFSLKPALSYALRGKGRVRCTLRLTRVSGPEDRPLIYAMAKGKRVGTNLNWNATVDYRISRFVTGLLSYTARKDPDRRILHTGQMEVRAYF